MAVSERINGLGLNGLRGNYQHPEYDGLCFRPPQFEVPENINGLGWFPRCSPLANFEKYQPVTAATAPASSSGT